MKIKFLMAIIIAVLFLTVPDFSHAQKRKVKTKPNQTKKTTSKVSSAEVKVPEADWQKITSIEGQFSILFPAKPQSKQNDDPNFTQYLYASSEDSENIIYIIMAQTPDQAVDLNEDVVLQNLRQSIQATDLLEITNISTSNFNGWRWKTNSANNFPKGWIQYGKTIRDKRTRRLYILTFQANGLDRANKFSKNMNKFFDSFKML